MKTLKENYYLKVALVIILIVLLCQNISLLVNLPFCLFQDIFRPPHTEVLISACKKPSVRGVPGGEVLLVHENLTDKIYLLDLQTGEKRKIPDDPSILSAGIFLNSELIWIPGGYYPHYVLDLRDGKRYELFDLRELPRGANGYFDPKYYTYLDNAEYFFFHYSRNYLIVLDSDFRISSDKRVILPQSAFEGGASAEQGKVLVELMEELSIRYEIIDLEETYNQDIPSPTGKYVIRRDGVYYSGTDLLAIPNEYISGPDISAYFKSWYFDESGVVLKENGDFLFTHPWFGAHFAIYKPVLKLNFPSEN